MRSSLTMIAFAYDDPGYLDWLADNLEGYVLNVRARQDPSYVVPSPGGVPDDFSTGRDRRLHWPSLPQVLCIESRGFARCGAGAGTCRRDVFPALRLVQAGLSGFACWFTL